MVQITHTEPEYAAGFFVVVASDYVLRDREGTPISETTFKKNFDDSVKIGRSWWWQRCDGFAPTFLPVVYYRSVRSRAYMSTNWPTEADVLANGIKEATALGIVNCRSARRYWTLCTPMKSFIYSGNADVGGNVANPRSLPGVVWTTGGGTLAMGGSISNFFAFTTVQTPPNPAQTGISGTLTVAPGTGAKLAVAAGSHRNARAGLWFNGTTLVVATATAMTFQVSTGAAPKKTAGLFDDPSLATPPFELVVWPVGVDPDPTNAEVVRVSSMDDSQGEVVGTITLNLSARGLYGTTPKPILNNYCLGFREKRARVYAANGQPEDSSAEVIYITAINGDTLSIDRATSDSINNGVGTNPRVIQVGDKLGITASPTFSFAHQRNSQAIGGFMHECGHGIGGKYWYPAETANWAYVDFSTGSPVVQHRDDTHDYSGGFGRDVGPGKEIPLLLENLIGTYEHTQHTQNDPLTVPLGSHGASDTGTGFPSVMIDWSQFPNLGWTSNERARIKKSPFVKFYATDPTLTE